MGSLGELGANLHLWIVAGVILLLIFASAIFSGSETALTTASRARLLSISEGGDMRAVNAMNLTEDKERLIGAILLGNNLVNIFATSLATMLFTILLGESGVAVATLVMTALVLVFAEVLPKTYAISNAETLACRVAVIFRFVVPLFAPIVNLVRVFVRGVLRLMGVEVDPKQSLMAAQEEIAGAIMLHHMEGSMEKAARDRLMGALDLHQRTVEEVMTHRRNLELIDANSAPEAIVERVLDSPHTRIPIFEDDPDNIVGIIHSKELIRTLFGKGTMDRDHSPDFASFDVRQIAMKPNFIPETVRLDDQMYRFLRQRSHLSMVVDEYGTLQGLVTLEDILEEIVGEIVDEHDVELPLNDRLVDKDSIEVEGDTPIRDLNRMQQWSLPDEDAVTIAGLVIHDAQAIPKQGASFEIAGYSIEVVDADEMRLYRLRVSKRPGRST